VTDWITATDAARCYGVTPRHLRRLAREQHWVTMRVGREVAYLCADLDEQFSNTRMVAKLLPDVRSGLIR